jgi:AraC-like DNA-binding protein
MDMTHLTYKGHLFASAFTSKIAERINLEMKEEACLTFVGSGVHELITPVERFKVTAKEALLMKCGSYVTTSGEGELVGVVFHLNPDLIKEAFAGRDIDFLHLEADKRTKSPVVELGEHKIIEAYVESIRPYFSSKSKVEDSLIGIKLKELVTILIMEGNKDILYLLGTIRKGEIVAFEKIIEANLNNNLTISELSHLTNYSESSFKRKFKQLYSTSPLAYFRTKRLQKASELLTSSHLSISEICWDCGFETMSHFSSAFKKEYSMSPRKYRQEKRVII